ncbi:MAG: hypothetical protein KJ793_04270 [Candidatus Omnitrophica bacterium]|nr:hypothetical protein [Candidatus Omnitrophota bacterium]
MDKLNSQKSGVALLIALGTVLMVAILGLVFLRHISSSSSLTQHQVGRTQAYYAAKAGLNYAYDKLRKGEWQTTPVYYGILNDDPALSCPGTSGGCITEPEFPRTIEAVWIGVVRNGESIALPSGGVPDCNPCTPVTGAEFCICVATQYAL